LEVINPHDRATRAGEQPILFEAAPREWIDRRGRHHGVLGDFYLLYTPLDLDEERLERGKIHLREVVKGVNAMFTKYGFSAKKLVGYGFAEQRISKVNGTPMLQTNSKEIADIDSFSTFDDLEALQPAEGK
jgi:CRISPR-associated protein Cmr2